LALNVHDLSHRDNYFPIPQRNAHIALKDSPYSFPIRPSFLAQGQTLPLVIRKEDCQLDTIVTVNDFLMEVKKHKPLFEYWLLQYGGVLLRGFPFTTANDFKDLVLCFSPEAHLNNYRDGISPRTEIIPGIFTSTEYPPHLNMAVHNEMSYTPNPPEKIFFFCQTAPVPGQGQTPIADSRKIYQSFPSALRDKFIAKGLRYIRNLPQSEGLGKSWQQTYKTTDRATVEKFCEEKGIQFIWKDDGTFHTEFTGPATRKHQCTGEMVWCNHAHLFHPSDLPESAQKGLYAFS
jgi:alpha-ketoglutarate-dependent taurine dioxygenase